MTDMLFPLQRQVQTTKKEFRNNTVDQSTQIEKFEPEEEGGQENRRTDWK